MGKSKKPMDTGQIIKGQCDGLMTDLEKNMKLFKSELNEQIVDYEEVRRLANIINDDADTIAMFMDDLEEAEDAKEERENEHEDTNYYKTQNN